MRAAFRFFIHPIYSRHAGMGRFLASTDVLRRRVLPRLHNLGIVIAGELLTCKVSVWSVGEHHQIANVLFFCQF